MRAFVVIMLMLVLTLTSGEPVAAKRVALVIGNSAYMHTPKLDNPINDATDVAAAFKALGFEVIEGFDLSKAAFDRKIRDFAAALSGAELGVFFYAGHGLQVGGQNFLVPIDAELTTAAALDFETMRLDLIHRTMERETKTNVLFLDACRNNPLARNLARSMGARSMEIGRGLAAVEAGVGSLISFSTQPGNIALDGDGRNSPFASALTKNLLRQGDDLLTILINVRNDVMASTRDRQVPWEHTAMRSRLYFTEPTSTENIALSMMEQQFWEAVKQSTSWPAIQVFVDRFPNGKYASEARGRIEELKEQERIKRDADAAQIAEQQAALLAKAEAEREASDSKRVEELRVALNAANKAAEEARAAAEALRNADVTADPGVAAGLAKQQKLRDEEADQAEWALARKLDTAAAFQSYLETHPTGRFVEQAKRSVAERSLPDVATVKQVFFETLVAALRTRRIESTFDPNRIGMAIWPTYMESRSPKAMTACINWNIATPLLPAGIIYSRFSGNDDARRSLIEAKASSLKGCESQRVTRKWLCNCVIVSVNGENALEPPVEWLRRFSASPLLPETLARGGSKK